MEDVVETIERPFFRPDVEGVRGVAILLVVAYHAGVPGFRGGFVGVDVFFVLSGYLITLLLVREIETTGRLDLIEFYARRARRLFPALALVLLATALFGYIVYSPSEQREFARSALATSAYVGNLYFAWLRTDYLGADAEKNPLLHTWSLSVEEQFYLLWPLLIWAAFVLGRRYSGSYTHRKWPFFFVAVVSAASFVLSLKLTYTHQPWAFFSSPTRAWEFALGGLGALVPILFHPRIARALGWFGVAALLYSASVFSEQTIFPGLAALVPTIGTLAILSSGAKSADVDPNKYFSMPWLQKLGNLSYSWYLWHWPVLTFAAAWSGRLTLPARLGCILLALGLAALSYRFVENPVRRNRFLSDRPVYSLLTAAGLTLFGVTISLVWWQVSTHALGAQAQVRISNARGDLPTIAEDCISNFTETTVNMCNFGNEGSSTIMVLFGDSHAAQWFPAMNAIAAAEGWRLVTFLKSACAPADISFVYPKLGRRYVECEQWRADTLRKIKQMAPSLVIITGSQWYASTVAPSEYTAGMHRTFGAIAASGAHIVYMWDTPRLGLDIPDCLARAVWQSRWRNTSTSSCMFDRRSALDENVHQLDLQASSGFSLTSVDLTNYICPRISCEPEIGNLIVYRDSNHITASFASSLAPVLSGIIKESLTQQNLRSQRVLASKMK